MARIRTIKPEFWTSEQVMECSTTSRLLFIGMWNFCDDAGNHPAAYRTLKAEVFPADDFDLDYIKELVDELISEGLVFEFVRGKHRFWHVANFQKLQQIPMPSDWQRRRIFVFERDGYVCSYCGASVSNPHCDHIFPRSRGGSDSVENLATACAECNVQKRDKTPEEWMAAK